MSGQLSATRSVSETVGVPSLLDPARFSKSSLSITELRTLDVVAKNLQRELTVVSEDLSAQVASGLETRYFLDFDVIRSAMDWAGDASTAEFWCSVGINLPSSVGILPGTLFEIHRYLKKRSAAVAELFDRPLAQGLYDCVAAGNPSAYPMDAYAKLINGFRRAKAGGNDLYVLTLLWDRLSTLDERELPNIDEHVFSRAVDALSRGSRADLLTNNRVDAINFSLCYACNQRVRHSNTRFVIVSNAPSMARLDAIVKALAETRLDEPFFEYGMVRSARTFAMRELLVVAGGGAAAAERIGFELVHRLADYRARLRTAIAGARKHGASPLVDKNQLHADSMGLFVHLMSSFDSAQQVIDSAKATPRKASLHFFQTTYNARNPSQFYEEMTRKIHSMLKAQGYASRLSGDEEVAEKPTLEWRNQDKDPRSFCKTMYSIVERNNVVAYVRVYEDRCTFVLPNRLRTAAADKSKAKAGGTHSTGQVPITEFIRTVNQIKASLFAAITKGQYVVDQRSLDDKLFVGDSSGRIQSSVGPARSDYTIDDICRAFKVLPSEVTFLRIDNEVFSVSYEGDVICLACAYDTRAEISVFLDELVGTSFKGRGIDVVVDDIVGRVSLPSVKARISSQGNTHEAT